MVFSTSSAVPVVVVDRVPVPVTLTVPPPVALKPAPLVVVDAEAAALERDRWPEPVAETAADAPVLSVFVPAAEGVAPPLLPDIVDAADRRPFVSLMSPESVIKPPLSGRG